MESGDADELMGGGVHFVVRRGSTIERPMGPHSSYVHKVLRFVRSRGFDACPQVLSVDRERASQDSRRAAHHADTYVALAGAAASEDAGLPAVGVVATALVR